MFPSDNHQKETSAKTQFVSDSTLSEMSFRLPIPNKITSKTVGAVYAEMLRTNRLNLTPTYQRARCWKKLQNDNLIDSIMRGFVIPQFTLYTLHPSNTDDAEDYAKGIRFECVDGQNRLCAIAAFRSGEPLVNAAGTPEPVVWMLSPSGGPKHFRDLSEEEQEMFDNIDLSLTIIQSPLTLEQRKAQFTRLQDGTRISRPEYMRNTTHPVSLFISRTGMRDLFDGVVRGSMTGIGDWLLVLADCITLYLHRTNAGRLEMLNRDAKRLTRVIECKEPATPDSVYDMVVTTPDDAELTRLFNQLFAILGDVKDKKIKYHKFCVVALFHQILEGAGIPSIDALCQWLKRGTTIIKTHKAAGGRDVDAYSLLLDDLASPPAVPPPAAPRKPSKAKRNALWAKYFAREKDGVCQCCQGHITSSTWEQAHIVAHANKGLYELDNLVPTCVGCNRSCGSEDLRTWCAREYPTAPFLA